MVASRKLIDMLKLKADRLNFGPFSDKVPCLFFTIIGSITTDYALNVNSVFLCNELIVFVLLMFLV